MNHCNKLNGIHVIFSGFFNKFSTNRATNIKQTKKRKRKERRSFSIFYVCKRFYVIVTTNHCPDACKAIALILDPFFKCNDGSLI